MNLEALDIMIFDQLKAVGTYHGHLLPAGMGLLAGLFFLFLMFHAGKLVTKRVLFLFAVVCFAGAYWWFTLIRS